MCEGHNTSKCHSIGISKVKQKSVKGKSRGIKKGKEKAIPSWPLCSTSLIILCMTANHFYLLTTRPYSACTATTSPTIIIDSSTTSHIHSDQSNFTNLKTSSSVSINGFGNGSRMIQGCREAQFYAQLLTGGQSHPKLYMLHAKLHTNAHISPSPLQSWFLHLIQWQVVGYFQELGEWQTCLRCYYKRKVIFTGTKGTDWLYHIDTLCWLKEFSYLVTQSPTIVEFPVNCWKQDEVIEGLEMKNEDSTIGIL